MSNQIDYNLMLRKQRPYEKTFSIRINLTNGMSSTNLMNLVDPRILAESRVGWISRIDHTECICLSVSNRELDKWEMNALTIEHPPNKPLYVYGRLRDLGINPYLVSLYKDEDKFLTVLGKRGQNVFLKVVYHYHPKKVSLLVQPIIDLN